MMKEEKKSPVGVIGLGIIGSRAAANLRTAGYPVVVWSRTPRLEADFLSSPQEVAENAKIIELFVSDGAALQEVVEAMLPVLTPAHIIINHATVAPSEVKSVGAQVLGRQAQFLDVPFTGSRGVAEKGQLTFMVGGAAETLEAVRAVLEVNSKAIVPIGAIGDAMVVKIATNLMVAVTVSAHAEALSLLAQADIPLDRLTDVLAHHAVRSTITDMKLPGMISGKFDTFFSLKHMYKDANIAQKMTLRKLPALDGFLEEATEAMQQGFSEEDFSVIARVFGFPPPAAEIAPETPTPGTHFRIST